MKIKHRYVKFTN